MHMYTCSSDGIQGIVELIVCMLGLPVALIVYCIVKKKQLDEEGGAYILYIEKECILYSL